MSLVQQIESDFLQAQKDRAEALVSTLRLLKAELLKKSKEPAMVGKEMTEEMVLQVLKSQVKQRQESIAEYEKAARQDLADKEKTELAIMEKYLPAQMSAEQVTEIVKQVVGSMPGANFGMVMKEVVKQLAGAADGKMVSELVKKELGQ